MKTKCLILFFTGAFLAGPVAAQTLTVSNLWKISTAEARNYVTSGSTERGIAYNPSNNHVYVASRAGGLAVAVLDGNDPLESNFLRFLDTIGISGGTFALSQIAVAGDGAIYAANLTTASGSTVVVTNIDTGEVTTNLTSPLRLYCWTNELASPQLVYVGNPGGVDANGAQISARWGDNIDIRGSGTNTQILIGSGTGGTQAAILSPSDGSMTNFISSTINVAGISAAAMQKGVAFYTNNSFFARTTGSGTTRLIQYDPATSNGTVAATVTINSSVAGIAINTNLNLLAGVQVANSAAAGAHNLLVYDLSNFAAPSLIGTIPFPTPYTANPNLVGGVDFAGNRLYAVDTQNGVVAAEIVVSAVSIPPSITTQPIDQTALAGGYVTFTVDAVGSKPLLYQWFFNDTNSLPFATNSTLRILNLDATNTGTYSVQVSNAGGETNSNPAVLTVSTSLLSRVATVLWQLAPGDRPWLTADNSQRGLAFNPANSNLLVISRGAGNNIYVLDSATGAQLRQLNTDPSIINAGGTFALNLVGAADDGAVYAGSLTTGSDGGVFKLYRWADDAASTVPSVAFIQEADSLRWGDSLDVRGGGTNTQILIGARDGGSVALLTTTNGTNFAATLIAVGDIPIDRIGLAFGEGNSYWSKQNFDGPFVQVTFDPAAGAGTVLNSYTNLASVTPIGFLVDGKILAAIALETPDNLRLYDLADTNAGPVLLDQDFFPTDNPNGNRTGAIDFGRGMVFALDTNNGILGARLDFSTLVPTLTASRNGNTLTLNWTSGTLQSTPELGTAFQDLPSARSPYPVDMTAPQQFFRVRR